jgi:putative addiction module component (TIGR02574 family)
MWAEPVRPTRMWSGWGPAVRVNHNPGVSGGWPPQLTPGVGCQKTVLPAGPFPWYILAMSIDQIAAEALRLPPRDRAMLAESLWESLVDPFEAPAAADEDQLAALALERDRQMEAGEVQALSHEELMARLRR